MGFVILGAGAGLVVSSLCDFANIFQHAFGIQGVVPNNEAIVSVAQKSFGKEMAMIMFFAMVITVSYTHLDVYKRQGYDTLVGISDNYRLSPY